MRAKTRRGNSLAIYLIDRGQSPQAIATCLGISLDGLYKRGERDPRLGEALREVKRPRQKRSIALEQRLRQMWLQPERYTVAQIATRLGVCRQTVYEWAADLGLQPVRQAAIRVLPNSWT
jgi:transposase